MRGLLAHDARIIITQQEGVLSGPKRTWPLPEVLVDPAASLKATAGEHPDKVTRCHTSIIRTAGEKLPDPQVCLRAQDCRKQKRTKG